MIPGFHLLRVEPRDLAERAFGGGDVAHGERDAAEDEVRLGEVHAVAERGLPVGHGTTVVRLDRSGHPGDGGVEHLLGGLDPDGAHRIAKEGDEARHALLRRGRALDGDGGGPDERVGVGQKRLEPGGERGVGALRGEPEGGGADDAGLGGVLGEFGEVPHRPDGVGAAGGERLAVVRAAVGAVGKPRGDGGGRPFGRLARVAGGAGVGRSGLGREVGAGDAEGMVARASRLPM